MLCKYGIEYVDDPATGKKIPTCRDRIAQIEEQEEAARLEAIRQEEERKAERQRQAKKRKKVIAIAAASVAGLLLLRLLIICISDFIRYKPLRDAFSDGSISAEFVKANYPDLQNEKRGLQVFEKELEKCHENNDLQGALDTLAVLARSDVYFSDWVINSQGNEYKDLSPYIQGWDSFINWIYEETVKNGTEIKERPKDVLVDQQYDMSDDIDETYEVYGYKVGVNKFSNDDSRIYRLVLYIPSFGWYKVDCMAKVTNSIVYGEDSVMVD